MNSLARLREISPDFYEAVVTTDQYGNHVHERINASPSLLAEAIVELADQVDALAKRLSVEIITDDEGHVI